MKSTSVVVTLSVVVSAIGCAEALEEDRASGLASSSELTRTGVQPVQPFAWKPPVPTNLRIEHIAPTGLQTFVGPADQELLLVADRVIDGKFQVDVRGFRGIYLIGATVRPEPTGTLKTKTGQSLPGVGTLFKFQTHEHAKDSFIFVAGVDYDAGSIRFGDVFNFGGKPNAAKDNVGNWPIVYLQNTRVTKGHDGWSAYHGGSFSEFVSHSDFVKFETGGVESLLVDSVDVEWGYQTFYTTPTHAVQYGSDPCDRRVHPTGKVRLQNVVMRMREAVEEVPVGVFGALGPRCVTEGNYYPHELENVWIEPARGKGAEDHVFPRKAACAPVTQGDLMSWPATCDAAGRRPFATGAVHRGGAASVVSASEVGLGRSVATLAELRALAN